MFEGGGGGLKKSGKTLEKKLEKLSLSWLVARSQQPCSLARTGLAYPNKSKLGPLATWKAKCHQTSIISIIHFN